MQPLEALTKIEAVLPEELKRRTETSRVFAPPKQQHAAVAGRLDELHASGTVWTLGAWCEMRSDFRNFRLDRIEAFRTLDRTFVETPETSLAAFLRGVGADPQSAR